MFKAEHFRYDTDGLCVRKERKKFISMVDC